MFEDLEYEATIVTLREGILQKDAEIARLRSALERCRAMLMRDNYRGGALTVCAEALETSPEVEGKG